MLTYRVGAAGSGGGMAIYVVISDRVPELHDLMSAYYANGAPQAGAAVIPNAAMNPIIAERLGIDPSRFLTTEELANLLNGKRADGAEIAGKKASKNSYIDLTFSAPKSFSVAVAFAPTAAERALLDKAFDDAHKQIMAHISEQIGTASIGANTGNKDRRRAREPAHIAYASVDHYSARPTYALARNGTTELIPLDKGAPHRHRHTLVMNAAVTESGRITSLHQQGLDQSVHEWGALFQGFLGVNLRKLGVNWELDSTPDLSFNERMGRMTDVPRWICDQYSPRTMDGKALAREIAQEAGLDLDTMSPDAKAELLGRTVNRLRRSKDLGGGEYQSWVRKAESLNYKHRSVLRPGQEQELRPAEERQREAFDISLPLMAEHFARRAVIEGSIPRIAVAKAFIQTGVESAHEVSVVTAAHRTEGVIQDGQKTSVHYAFDTQKRYARVTTQLSVDMETEAVGLLRSAFEDKSVPIAPEAIQRAIDKLAVEGFDFTTPHGLKQRELAEKAMDGHRAMAWIGVAGSGKSSLLRIPILAWHEAGRETMGITVAWRQTTGLIDAGVGKKTKSQWVPDKEEMVAAGIGADKTFALDPFLRGVESGKIKPTENTTVIVDELGLVGTTQILRLARLQAKHGFQLVGLGDDMQNQPVDAGATFDLMRRALGPENVPALVNTIRQETKRDQDTTLLFRSGDAEIALRRKDEDGTLFIVPGGYDDTVRATVDLWWTWTRENANNPRYTLGISVPTNADGRAIGEAIRASRQAVGEVGRDLVEVGAIDQNGTQYNMRIGVGDRVRLFHRVSGKNDAGKYSIVGNNGSVVTVLNATNDGMRVRSANGRERWVGWEALRKDGGPIRLAYGDAVTIDARQSDTVTDHITSMPAGSAGVNGFNIYTADSRHRKRGAIITSQGAELKELQDRRPLGDPANRETDPAKVKAAIMENLARNLSRQPKKTLALDFLDDSIGLRSGTVDAKLAAWFRQETREATGNAPVGVSATQAPAASQTLSTPVPEQPSPSLKATAGWKLHLNVAPTLDDRLTRDIADWLHNEGVSFKVGQSGGQDGKGITVYVGPHAKARDLVDELEGRFRLPDSAPLLEDARWSAGVNARFDAHGDKEFHQYGVGGVPMLIRHVQDGYGTPDRGFNEKNAREAEGILISRYGAFYGPGRYTPQPVSAALSETTTATAGAPVDPTNHTPRPKPQERPKMSEADIYADFADALRREGFQLRGSPTMDGKWHREKVAGDKGATKSGRYRAFTDGLPAGFIQNFKTGSDGITWRAERPTAPLTAEQRAELATRQAARAREQAEALQAAAAKAQSRWAAGSHVRQHPYLTAKGIGAGPEMRQDRHGNLITALRNASGEIRNIQTIGRDGTKLFVKGAQVVGLFTVVGKIQPDVPVLIAEGVATARTVHDATGLAVVVAYNAGNLGAVSRAVAEIAPSSRQIFAADNDHQLPRREENPLPNVGKEKAEAAAMEIGGVVLLPRFGDMETTPVREGDKPPTDWNDFAKLYGKAKLTAVIMQQLMEQGVDMEDAKKPKITQEMRDLARQNVVIQQQNQAAQTGQAREASREQESSRSEGLER